MLSGLNLNFDQGLPNQPSILDSISADRFATLILIADQEGKAFFLVLARRQAHFPTGKQKRATISFEYAGALKRQSCTHFDKAAVGLSLNFR
jgi:hypothetical protein